MLSIPAAFWVGDDAFTIALLIASVLMLVIVEVLNSAIEAVVDRIGPERHDLSRMAKDLGSLAVLLATIIPGLLWLAALYQKFARVSDRLCHRQGMSHWPPAPHAWHILRQTNLRGARA